MEYEELATALFSLDATQVRAANNSGAKQRVAQ
jgi:hypothetical protein